VQINAILGSITKLYSIVILHGLKGNPYGTFKSTGTGFYWPSHIQQHLPCARIMVFGYLADIVDGSNNSLGVYQHAESLLLHLKNLRLGSEVSSLAVSCFEIFANSQFSYDHSYLLGIASVDW
jgi:hypothetical protein